jgi:hypothetical protein
LLPLLRMKPSTRERFTIMLIPVPPIDYR